MALRAALVALFTVFGVAGTVTAAGLFELDDIIRPLKVFTGPGVGTDLPEPGKPQTIMLLGTDARLGADAGSGARADTIILAHLDADAPAITLTSIPRDLKVTIPGQDGAADVTDKINSAYARGGVKLTVETVKRLFAPEGGRFPINHVIQVDFLGFRRMVDYLGCTYIDIDRRYFNDISGPGGYAVIDIQPGYQKLCGEDALAYVRYRHTDNDLVRASRQQDFLRQMLHQPGVEQRLNLSKRKEITKIAGEYTRVDKSLTEKGPLVTLLKLGLNVAGNTVQQVPFGVGKVVYDGDYLTVSQDAIDRTRELFLSAQEPPDTDPEPRKTGKKGDAGTAGLVDVSDAGETAAISVNRRMRFPFYYPKLGTGAGYDGDPRLYSVAGHQAYRMVVPINTVQGQYYGIQGMNWDDAPLLDAPHDDVTIGGRHLEIYYDGKRVRLVAWHKGEAVYYVHNTLDRALTRLQLQAIARSFTRLGAK
jgi:LCP family protein required for cell wall assembly